MEYKIRKPDDLFMLDRNWSSYLKDKVFHYDNSITFRQKKKFIGYEDCNDGKKTVDKEKQSQQEKEKKIAAFCKKYGIIFEPTTEISYGDPYVSKEFDKPTTVREVRMTRKADFIMPADLAVRLLHKICRQSCETLIRKYLPLDKDFKPIVKLDDDRMKIADAAVSMIIEDAQLLRKTCPQDKEYQTRIIVNPDDFRYTEASGEIAGIIFKNEGITAFKDKYDRDMFAGAVLKRILEELKKTDDVLDVYVEAANRYSYNGTEMILIIMYK